MRVQTGSAKGRRLKTHSGKGIRPTTGRVKKSIFDTLGDIRGRIVLDLFAGAGSLGIEALSRNAEKAVFVEKDRTALNILKDNIEKCGFTDRSEVIGGDYRKVVKILEKQNRKFNLVFIDPPYVIYDEISPEDLIGSIDKLLATTWEIVIEHNLDNDMEKYENHERTKIYGGTKISYFRNDIT